MLKPSQPFPLSIITLSIKRNDLCFLFTMQIAAGNITPITLAYARELEKEEAYKKAIGIYRKLLKQHSTALQALARLMLIYRKQKQYPAEIDAIDKAIHIHEASYRSLKPRSSKADQLSRQLNQALGLADKKGKSFYKSDELLKLEKRKKIVMKKLET